MTPFLQFIESRINSLFTVAHMHAATTTPTTTPTPTTIPKPPSSKGDVDWAGLKQRRDAYVKRLNDTYKVGRSRERVWKIT
jgi:hypothetical protein